MPGKTKLIIRRATRGDVAAIMRIENTSFGCSAWGRDDFLGYLAEPETCIFGTRVRADQAGAGIPPVSSARNR